MLTLLATIVVLAVLILVHEFGHLVAAKTVGIAVPRFSLGFGPKVFGFHAGGTEYVLSALPLGGYVKMAGFEEAEMLEGGPDPEAYPPGQTFESKPLWARVWVISAGVLMNFLFAAFVFTLLPLTIGQTSVTTREIVVLDASADPANQAQLAAIPPRAAIRSVNGERVEDRADIQNVLLAAPAGAARIEFDAAAPVTLQLPSSDSARAVLINLLRPAFDATIGRVVPDHPAEAAGLKAADQILAVNGKKISSWPEFVQQVRTSANEPLALQVSRGGEEIPITVTPRAQQVGDEEIGLLGIEAAGLPRERLGPIAALETGFAETWFYSDLIFRFLGELVTGGESPRNVGSILSIGEASGQAARLGTEYFLRFMGIFSINLAILNLLPIPILDGGHLLFLGLEALRGRPLSVEQRLRLSHVGLIMVIGLMVWAMTNDVLRLFGI